MKHQSYAFTFGIFQLVALGKTCLDAKPLEPVCYGYIGEGFPISGEDRIIWLKTFQATFQHLFQGSAYRNGSSRFVLRIEYAKINAIDGGNSRPRLPEEVISPRLNFSAYPACFIAG